METEKMPGIDKCKIEKIVFWDYGAGALDILPVETVAQRLVDRWAAIDEALLAKKINWKTLIEVLKRIDAAGDNVVYCESVREYVIKTLIEKHIKKPDSEASERK